MVTLPLPKKNKATRWWIPKERVTPLVVTIAKSPAALAPASIVPSLNSNLNSASIEPTLTPSYSMCLGPGKYIKAQSNVVRCLDCINQGDGLQHLSLAGPDRKHHSLLERCIFVTLMVKVPPFIFARPAHTMIFGPLLWKVRRRSWRGFICRLHRRS